jgi:hypothetical protein
MPIPEILEELSAYTKRSVALKKVQRENEYRMELPLPNGKSCYERSGRKGGATIVLSKHGVRSTAQRLDLGKQQVVKEMMEYRAFVAWFRNRAKVLNPPSLNPKDEVSSKYGIKRSTIFGDKEDAFAAVRQTLDRRYDGIQVMIERVLDAPKTSIRTWSDIVRGKAAPEFLGNTWELAESLDGNYDADSTSARFYELQYKCLQPGYIQPWLDPELDIDLLLSPPDWWSDNNWSDWTRLMDRFFSSSGMSEWDLLSMGPDGPREEDLPEFMRDVPRQKPLADAFEDALEYAQDLSTQTARLTPIVEVNGKIRVITTHSSESVWAARAMTRHIMVHTKRLVYSRQMMRDQVVRISNKSQAKEGLIVYSADLSKATDPISISLARHVLADIVSVIGKPGWWDRAVEATISAMTIECPDKSSFTNQCGALMGLGPCWSVLTILNAFAAHRAGAPQGSYQVCGDDLIGLWPKGVCDAYEDVLTQLGLEANKSKSFRSPTGGVFCERLVRRDGDCTAFARHCLRIGEAVGTKSEAGRNGRAVVDRLRLDKNTWPSHFDRVHPMVRRAARSTSGRNAIEPNATGRFDQGGGGVGEPDAVAVVAFFMWGPTRLSKGDDLFDSQEFRELKMQLRRQKPLKGKRSRDTVYINDVIVDAKTALEARLRVEKGIGSSKPVNISYKAVKHMCRDRRHMAKDLIKKHGGPIAAIRAAVRHANANPPYVRVSPKVTRDVCCALRRKAFASAIRSAQRSWKVPIPEEVGLKLLRDAGLEGERVNLWTLRSRAGHESLRHYSPNDGE